MQASITIIRMVPVNFDYPVCMHVYSSVSSYTHTEMSKEPPPAYDTLSLSEHNRGGPMQGVLVLGREETLGDEPRMLTCPNCLVTQVGLCSNINNNNNKLE